jgi:hypothetical protein
MYIRLVQIPTTIAMPDDIDIVVVPGGSPLWLQMGGYNG